MTRRSADRPWMCEISKYIGQRFIKGLREAPCEFVAPLIVAARGIRFVAGYVWRQLDLGMEEAREKVCRRSTPP